MKRALVILTSCIIMVMASVSMCFAAQTLEITDTSPKDGATGTSLENLSVKLWFNETMYSDKYNKANTQCFKITDSKGKEVPTIVKFNKQGDYQNQVLVLMDTNSDYKVEQSTEYTLTISDKLVSADGNTLTADSLKNNTIKFTTQNQKRAMMVNMLLMLFIVVIMIGATMRSTKKGNEKDNNKKQEQKVNPYKEAKKTGKSVEEIVAKDQKSKAKKAAKDAKAQEKEEKEKAKEEERERIAEYAATHKRVSGPRPISAAGSTYKTGRKAEAEKKAKAEAAKKAKGTTNPKKKGKKKKKK